MSVSERVVRKYVLDRLVSELCEELSASELKIMTYMLEHVSVGELIASIELRHKVRNHAQVIRNLVMKGHLEKGPGCINLSGRWRSVLRERARKEGTNLVRAGRALAAAVRKACLHPHK